MVERDAIETLLKTGSWRTTRSRSPHPYDPRRDSRRTYGDSRPSSSGNRAYRPTEPPIRRKRPPPPCCEDEEESLAKEHQGEATPSSPDEEARHRGEIDQQPIILEVHENNPERRFVIVPGAAEGEDAPKTTQARYEHNTCRKYVIVPSEKGTESGESENVGDKHKSDAPREGSPKESSPRDEEYRERRKDPAEVQKRRSHQDLPRLNTEFQEEEEPKIRRSNSRRDREKPLVHQEAQAQGPSHDTTRERSNTRPTDGDFLLPGSVKIGSRRRERAYSDVRSDTASRLGRSPSTRRDPEIEVSSDRRRAPHSSRYTPSSSTHYRASSTTTVPTRDGQYVDRAALVQPYSYGDPEDIFAFMAPGDDFMTGKPTTREVSPPRRALNNESPPPHPRGAREMPNASPSRRRQVRPSTRDREPDRDRDRDRGRDRDGYSSDDSYRERRANWGSRPLPTRPVGEQDASSADQGRRPTSSRLGAVPPLGAPISDEPLLPGPRSATFPSDKSRSRGERSISPPTAASASPSRRPAPTTKAGPSGRHSRDPSVGSMSTSSPPLPPPTQAPRPSTLDRTVPSISAAVARLTAAEAQSPMLYWQSGRTATQPGGRAVAADDDDAIRVGLLKLPECRWKTPTSYFSQLGGDGFRALKRAENFEICPDCFGALFANTEYHNLFVMAGSRVGTQLISCDFGSSVWYRIAYLLTLKHDFPDLRLLQGIASVAARKQDCPGRSTVARNWYSMMAPGARRPVKGFNVCPSCTRMVGVLFPELASLFVPLNPHETQLGICELHFVEERKRFFDYIEEMNDTSDMALTNRTAPNLVELVDRVREISIHQECVGNIPVPGRKWHVLQRIPNFTVCEECFNDVVWPMIEDKDSESEMPRNFYKQKQQRSWASCLLSGERLRRAFDKACKYDDFDYLDAYTEQHISILAPLQDRYIELMPSARSGNPESAELLQDLSKQLVDVEQVVGQMVGY
ncbi:uncharacterized protein C8A04DRAFT_8552 [Dichotomopilus funicola]|uniref:Uncharacterized protein n=1 Tax=Dichotomopilus funicola TaxID=1934379 RepID=A0AAN6VB10_9PEZI|nr:hypothetical protein C8A04DRAFT_8552 [Dichotomopilus funicola]